MHWTYRDTGCCFPLGWFAPGPSADPHDLFLQFFLQHDLLSLLTGEKPPDLP